jgi:hypothetical protein
MTPELKSLIEAAKKTRQTEAERQTQRISFAYGNARIENENITRDTVRRESERLNREADAE